MNHVIWCEWVAPTNFVTQTMLECWIWLGPVCSGGGSMLIVSAGPERKPTEFLKCARVLSSLVFPHVLPQGIGSGPCLQSSVLLFSLLLILLYFSRLTQIKGLCSPLQHHPSRSLSLLPSARPATPLASMPFSHNVSAAKDLALWSQLCQTIIKVTWNICHGSLSGPFSDERRAAVSGPFIGLGSHLVMACLFWFMSVALLKAWEILNQISLSVIKERRVAYEDDSFTCCGMRSGKLYRNCIFDFTIMHNQAVIIFSMLLSFHLLW